MKKIEEAANQYFDLASMDIEVMIEDNQQIDYDDVVINAFKAGVEFAQRWIPIYEELPKKDDEFDSYSENVLAKTDRNEIVFGYFELNEKIFSSYNIYDGEITHWRPIELL